MDKAALGTLRPSPRFWPAIDDGLRRAAYERGVKVRLLISCWGHSEPSMRAFLHSLAALHDNRTHYDIQVVSACHRPTPSPCAGPYWAHGACGGHLSSDGDSPECTMR